MIFDILTLFPEMFSGVFSESIIGRAIQLNLVSIEIHNIRDYSGDSKHKTVDDYPYGGEAGMVLKPEPVAKAILDSMERLSEKNPIVIYLTPRGEPLTQEIVKELLLKKAIILLCGRYKGIDERICEKYVNREISIGDFVISGGEIAAMALVDAIVRLIPGALGNRESAENDSFYNILLSPPQYTRPEIFEGIKVPEVLLSGHHAKIEEWRQKMSIEITKKRRPDLWRKYIELNKNKNEKKNVPE